MSALTELELEAVGLRAHGLSNQEIADVLGVSLDAVKRRLWRAKTRLGTTDTAHTIAQCYRRGLLDLDVVETADQACLRWAVELPEIDGRRRG